MHQSKRNDAANQQPPKNMDNAHSMTKDGDIRSVEGGSSTNIAGRLCMYTDKWLQLAGGQWAHNFIKHGWQLRGCSKHVIYTLSHPQKPLPTEHHYSDFERQVRRDTVEKYAKLGIIEQVPEPLHADGGIYHQFICVLNKEEARGCLSCTSINEYIPYTHFKMEGLHTVRDVAQVNDYMGSLDISKYYPHYKVNEDHKKYLRFVVDGIRWQYVGCPFGLSNLPFLCTKALKPLVKKWRAAGIRCVNLLDDVKVFNQDKRQCLRDMQRIETDLESHGFVLNTKKRVLPTQVGDCFGLDLDTTSMSLQIPGKKRKDVVQSTKTVLKQDEAGTLTIRKMAGLLGKVNFLTPAWTSAKTHVSALQQDKNRALHRANKRWNTQYKMSQRAREQAYHLITSVQSAPPRCFIMKGEPQITLTGDASSQGYGVYDEADGEAVEGFWTRAEAARSSNRRELLTPCLGIQALHKKILSIPRDETGKIRLRYRSDNSTTVSNINRRGGASAELTDLLAPTLRWAERNGVELEALYIPGKENVISDAMSRRGIDRHDWRVKQRLVNALQDRWGKFSVDAFATRLSSRVSRFWSMNPEPGSSAVDAFAQSWTDEQLIWACPPPNQIAKVVRKAVSERANVVLCVPAWEMAPWWPLLRVAIGEKPVRLPANALEVSSSQGQLPQGSNNWTMVAFKLHCDKQNRNATRLKLLRFCIIR
jgi:hypothetical protein